MFNQIKIKIEGKDLNYFLKEMIQNHINIYDILQDKNHLILLLDYEDYLTIKKWRKTYRITILKRYGKNYYQYLWHCYRIFIISIIVGIIINILLSKMIFQIEVIHPNQEIQRIVKQDLKEWGIQSFHFKVNSKKREKIKESILKKETNKIEWMEIEEIGTKYTIRVEERKKNKEKERCKERSIIAKKEALILEINATEGEVSVRKNEYVEKGQVLISGLIHNKEKVMSKKCAQGKVYGEVWYTVVVNVPKQKEIEKKTNSKQWGLSLEFLNDKKSFSNPYSSYRKRMYNIEKSNFLPFSIGISIFQKTKKVNKNRSLKEAEVLAIQLSEKKLKKELNSSGTIIGKKVLKKQENDSKIIIEVFFKVKEDITDYLDLSKVDINLLNQEEKE